MGQVIRKYLKTKFLNIWNERSKTCPFFLKTRARSVISFLVYYQVLKLFFSIKSHLNHFLVHISHISSQINLKVLSWFSVN